MMDDIAEQQDVAREISDAISNPVAFGESHDVFSVIEFRSLQYFRTFPGQDVDEDELEAELEALEQEELDKDLLGVGTSTAELPEVPTGDIKEPAAAAKEKKKGKFIHRTHFSYIRNT